MTQTTTELLDLIRHKANGISSICDDRGMAAVKLLYHPYEANWQASVSWSDDSSIARTDDSVEQALILLSDALSVEHQRIRNQDAQTQEVRPDA